jgi:hypothetical protein
MDWMMDSPQKEVTTTEAVSNKFVNYNEYINSDEWRIRARMIRKAAGNRCQLCNCNNKSLHVHHRSYDRLGDEHPGDLTVLCEDCHKKFHSDAKYTREEVLQALESVKNSQADQDAFALSLIILGPVGYELGDEEDKIRKYGRNTKLAGSLLARAEVVTDSLQKKLAQFNAALRIIKHIQETPIEEFEERIHNLKEFAIEWREVSKERLK